MKHLKLLGLLLAVLTTVFSYGQGTVAIRINEGQSMTTIAAHVDASSPFGSNFMTGSGFVVGMARGTDTIHASTPAGSNFGLFDPTDPNGPAITTSLGGDGSLVIDMPHELTIAVDSMNNFYLGVVFMGFAGTYSEPVTLSAGGTVIEVTFTAYNADDSTQTVTPTITLMQAQTDMQCELYSGMMVGSGFVVGMAQGVGVLHAHLPANSNFSIVDPNAVVGAAGVGEGGADMPTLLKDLDIDMTTNPDAPSFYVVLMYQGPAGDFNETLELSAQGAQTVYVDFFAHVQQQGGDTTQVGDAYMYPSTTQLVLTGANPDTWALATGWLTINAGGIDTLQLQMQSGRNIQIGDNGYFVNAKSFSLNYQQSTLDVQLLLNTVTPGVYTDVLTISAPGTNLQPIEVYVSAVVEQQGGDTTHVEPGYFNCYETSLFFNCTLTSLQDTAFRPSTFAQFYEYNLDSLVVELVSGARYTLGNETTGQMGSHLVYTYEPNTKISDQVKVIFTGMGVTEPGYYVDTMIYRPYDGNGAMQPIYVILTTEVRDNTQPMFRLDQDQVSQSKEKDSPWYNCVMTASAYVENIHNVHFWLAQGTHFKLLDIREFNAGSLPETLDPMYQHTSIVYDSLFLTQGHCDFYILQKVEEAGSFTDTLWIEPEGIDGIFPVLITGTVTDWSGGNVSWQDRGVTVSLRGDSLIVSGTGSTSDYGYSDYKEANTPWYQDLRNHFSYDEMPKHLVVEPGVSRLGAYSMQGFEFQTVDLGQLDSLGTRIFSYCYPEVLELPASIDYLDCYALQGIYPQKIINNLRPDVAMCNNPFENMYPSTMVANTTMLIEIYEPGRCLLVPANDTIKDIYVAYGYAYEEPVVGFDLIVDHPMVLDDATIPAVQNPSVFIYSTMYDSLCGHLDVPVMTSLHMNKFVMRHFYGEESPFARFEQEVKWGSRPYFSMGYDGVNTTLVNDGMLTADTVMLRNKISGNMWHFTGLPFNQKVSEIQTGQHQYYCIRRFDAARQAAGQYDSVWVDVEANDTLRAGEGFIIQGYTPMDQPQEITFTAMNDAAKENIFTPSIQSLPLQQHPAELVWNANWNFLVNPYPCFYDTREIGGNGVITVYDNRMGYYQCYSILDDYYVLMPNEGFLYQAAAGETALRMPLEGRQHNARAAGVAYLDPYRPIDAPERGTRAILNFYLEQNSNKDRARVVLNEAASMDYEVGVDAAKLFAPGSTSAQLYAEQGGAKQSILERPMGNGIVYLGVKLMESGDCTISVPETKGMDIMMLDTETNVMTNLSLTDYTFFGTPGENSRRFVIGLAGDATFLDFITGNSGTDVVKVIENGHVYILRGSDKYDVLGNKH